MTSESENGGVTLIKRIEWIVAIMLSAVVLFLLVVRTTHAGALWRDECDSVQLARMPRIADVLGNLQYTAFPVLFPAIVRAYTSALGTSDIALRSFGLIVGMAFIAAAWFQSRQLHGQVPLLLPALVGLNVNFLTCGTWVRGYGIGSVLLVLAFALTAKFIQQPNRRGFELMFLAWLISMQCLFFNGALIPAIILAAACVLLIRREWKWTVVLLCGAIVCGASYAPYILKVFSKTSEWAIILQMPASFDFLWQQFLLACGGPYSAARWIWLGSILLVVVGAAWRVTAVWKCQRPRERDTLLFGLVTIVACVAASYLFFRLLRSIVHLRYYLALVCLLAAAADLIVANLARFHLVRVIRVLLVAVATFALPFAAWPKIIQRQTNIDLIARMLEKEAGPRDLVVIDPWAMGISFHWYYHGRTPWVTVPTMDEHRLHRYDLLKEKMMALAPLEDVEQAISGTIKSGNRVWLVGYRGTRGMRAGLSPSPAPDPEFGWQFRVYGAAWSQQLATFVREHAVHLRLVAARIEFVSNAENLPTWVADGWYE